MRVRIALEGNIGSGKSTLLRFLRARGIRVVDEPLQRWQGRDSPGSSSNLLSLFYNDPKRWAFTFQSAAFFTRAQSAIDSYTDNDSGLWVLERSLHSDKYCFATNCFKTGLFTQAEWDLYLDIHQFTMQQFPALNLDGFVYLRTQPSTAMRRILARAREEESAIPLEYLQQLHTRHEEWLMYDSPYTNAGVASSGIVSRATSSDGIPVLVLDCDRHLDVVQGSVALPTSIAGEIAAFAEELGASMDGPACV